MVPAELRVDVTSLAAHGRHEIFNDGIVQGLKYRRHRSDTFSPCSSVTAKEWFCGVDAVEEHGEGACGVS